MSNTRELRVIDANVILRFLLRDEEALAAKAATILRSAQRGKAAVVCDPVTLAEVVYVPSSYYELPNEEISDGLIPLLQTDGFLMTDTPRYLRALRLFRDTVKHFGDACACAAALEECEGRLYSFDRKLSSVPGLKREEDVPSQAQS